jgi:hypothetical protein
MNRYLPSALALALGLAAATGVMAQTPSPQTEPQSSSTPAEAPPANGAEPSSASSPHQREATGKASHDQMMKDCIAKEQANNSSTTAAQAKKTCKAQMKSQSKNY